MQKSCKNEKCQRKFDRNAFSELCLPCTNAYKSGEVDRKRRNDNTSRQHSGFQSQTQTQSTLAAHPPSNNLSNFPDFENPATSQPLPKVDVTRMYNTYQAIEAGSSNPDDEKTMIKDMFGMILHMFSKDSDNMQMKENVSSNIARIDALEAKVGKPEDVAKPLSIAVRNLPLPGPGVSDLQLVRSAFDEIRAEGVEVERDIVKAVRKGVRPADNYPGTVMVEMRDDTSRASIMKTKKNLEAHHNPGLRKLIIKNYKSEEEMKADRKFTNLLKRIPGNENCYFAGNGQIRENNEGFQPNHPHPQSQFQRPRFQQNPPQMFNVPPPPRHSAPPPANAPPPPPLLAPLFPAPAAPRYNPSLFDTLIQSSHFTATGKPSTTPSDSLAGQPQQVPDGAPPATSDSEIDTHNQSQVTGDIDNQSRVTREDSHQRSGNHRIRVWKTLT